MSVFIFNDEIEAGATVYWKCQWFTDAKKTQPKDLTGATLDGKLYDLATGAEIEGAFEIIKSAQNDMNGIFYAKVLAATTEDLTTSTAFSHRYKIWCTEPDGITKSVGQKGQIMVLE